MSKIQLKHPEGKHAVKMDQHKYDVLHQSIKKCLKNGPLRHKDLTQEVVNDFHQNNIEFEGSIEWHLESVKLDMEANGIVKREKVKSVMMFSLV